MKKMNNKGAALITVVVIISFVSILATVALYLSGLNFSMKATDIKTKDSFYEAETALEEIKASLILEASTAFDEAYTKVMSQYGNYYDGGSRATAFKSEFFNRLQTNWQSKLSDLTDKPGSCATVLNSMVSAPYTGSISVVGSGEFNLSHVDEGYVLLEGVCLAYTKNDFTTEIQTDYMIKLPDVKWEADHSNKSWTVGDTTEEVKNKTIDMAEYVQYYNWVKK